MIDALALAACLLVGLDNHPELNRLELAGAAVEALVPRGAWERSGLPPASYGPMKAGFAAELTAEADGKRFEAEELAFLATGGRAGRITKWQRWPSRRVREIMTRK